MGRLAIILQDAPPHSQPFNLIDGPVHGAGFLSALARDNSGHDGLAAACMRDQMRPLGLLAAVADEAVVDRDLREAFIVLARPLPPARVVRGGSRPAVWAPGAKREMSEFVLPDLSLCGLPWVPRGPGPGSSSA